jgi:hypothetical protein
VLLSPTPLPAEKQRELPTTPISVPIQGTPSPLLTQVEEELLTAEASIADGADADVDESGRFPGREIDGVSGNGHVVAEKAPPTPAKDGDAVRSSSQTVVSELASEGTSGSET